MFGCVSFRASRWNLSIDVISYVFSNILSRDRWSLYSSSLPVYAKSASTTNGLAASLVLIQIMGRCLTSRVGMATLRRKLTVCRNTTVISQHIFLALEPSADCLDHPLDPAQQVMSGITFSVSISSTDRPVSLGHS